MKLPVQESGFPLFQSCEHVPDRPGSMGRRTNPRWPSADGIHLQLFFFGNGEEH